MAGLERGTATSRSTTSGTTSDVSGQTTFTFSSDGVLQIESSPGQGSLNAAQETAGAGACPTSAASCTVWTSSASGRSLTLAFDGSGQLVSATDGEGTTVSYCYFGQSCAEDASGGGSQDLYSTDIPGNGTTTYNYDVSNANPDLVHDILSENLPSGGTVSNTYDSSGRMMAQDAPSGDEALSYSGDYESESGGSTVVSTTPAGSSTSAEVDYQYSSGALVAETTAYGTRQAATEYFDLDDATLVPTTVQDGNNDQTNNTLDTSGSSLQAADVTFSTDAMGNTTEEQYNSYNQAWCEVGPAEYANGVTCPSSAPSSPPAPGASDPWEGATINFYNSADELTATTGPLGRTTTYSYTGSGLSVPAGLQYCSVAPAEYAAGVQCAAYGHPPTPGTSSSTFDSAGDVISQTSPSAISAVGPADTVASYLGASCYNLPDSPNAVGDLLVLGVINDTWAKTVSSVSGGGVSSWASAGAPYEDGTDGQIMQIWYGTVTSTGSSSIAINWSGSVNNIKLTLQEFSASPGAAWSLDTEGSSSSPFPSLSAEGTGELYFGTAMAWGEAAAGTTPGMDYDVVNDDFVSGWDTDVSGTFAPTATGAGSLAALFVATPLTTTVSSRTPIYSVGSAAVYSGSVGASHFGLSDSPSAVGDLLVLGVINDTWAKTVSSVSGGGASSWASAGAPYEDGADGHILQVWYGTVSSTGSSSLTVTWSGSVDNADLVLQEFSSGAAATWSLDTDGNSSSPFPSLSAQSGEELYFGTAMAWGDAAAGSTPGMGYNVVNDNFLFGWDTNTAGAFSPTATGAGSVAALFSATTSTTITVVPSTTTYAYTDPDHPGLPTVTTGPDGEVTTDVYNAAGQVTSSTVSFGWYSATTLSAYDSAGQLYCTVAPQEVATGVTCPTSPPSASDPVPGATNDFYNTDGQLVQTTSPTGGPRSTPMTTPATSTAPSGHRLTAMA